MPGERQKPGAPESEEARQYPPAPSPRTCHHISHRTGGRFAEPTPPIGTGVSLDPMEDTGNHMKRNSR